VSPGVPGASPGGTGVPAAASSSLANPASTSCIHAGGQVEIKNETGGQVGYCHLPDGRVCEEWALYRNNQCVAPAS
jgi:putative hemolysin